MNLRRNRLLWLIPPAVCGLLISPMAIDGGTFGGEWIDHLWLVWVQSHNIRDFGFPSYFLHSTILGAYYPFYAFYGGTLYAIAGLVTIAVGPVSSFVLLYFVAFVSAYAGWTWLAMQAGLRGWPAFLPGALAVTAPYAISVAYGRGDFAETLATSMIPLVAASGLAIVRAEKLSAPIAAAFLFSVTMLTGSHTLTLVWGTAFLGAVALIGALCWRDALGQRARRLGQLAGLTGLGLAINAWYIIPLALYSGSTMIGEHPAGLSQTSFTALGELFSPLRSTAAHTAVATGGGIQAQLPVLALASVLVFAPIAWRRLPRERRLLVGALGGLFALVLVLLIAPSLIEHLPRFWRFIQFPYRLVTYADLLVIGLLTLVLAGLRSSPRVFRTATLVVAVIAAISTAQAMTQLLSPPFGPAAADFRPLERDAATASLLKPPPAWFAGRDFSDVSAPIVDPATGGPLNVPITSSRRLRYDLDFPPGREAVVATNITGGPNFVQVEGAEVAGRTADELMVLRLPASKSSRNVELSPRDSAPIVIGQAISVASLIAAAGLIGALALRGRRLRRDQADEASLSAD